MKKYLILLASAFVLILSGCSKDNNGGDGGNGDYEKGEAGLVFSENGINYIGNGDKDFPVPVGGYTLDASKQYVLRGWVYMQDGSRITIPAGTVIKGDKKTMASLIIEPGAQIIARGTVQKPIVFTSNQAAGSRKPGDWGGVIVCGNGINNKGRQQIEGGPRTRHGGTVENDNSGVLSYVRIEFAGYPFESDKEINGLTFGSVGSGTQVDHIQVSYSNDDSFEWFGGSVSCKYLVAYHGWDDDFDTDNGFSGTMQFLLGVRHPKLADFSKSNGFESDNNSDGSTDEPFTKARFCNVTLVGPIGQDAAFQNLATDQSSYINGGTLYPNNGSKMGQFQSGVQIRRSSRISLCNSVITGYPIGLIVENDKGSATQTFAAANTLVKNVFFGGFDIAAKTYDHSAGAKSLLGCDANNTYKDSYSNNGGSTMDEGQFSFSHSYILDAARANTVKATIAELGLSNPVSVTAALGVNTSANYGPAAGSILRNSTLTVPSGFDTKGNGYAGAFASDAAADNWMAGWTEFDPQNKAY